MYPLNQGQGQAPYQHSQQQGGIVSKQNWVILTEMYHNNVFIFSSFLFSLRLPFA